MQYSTIIEMDLFNFQLNSGATEDSTQNGKNCVFDARNEHSVQKGQRIYKSAVRRLVKEKTKEILPSKKIQMYQNLQSKVEPLFQKDKSLIDKSSKAFTPEFNCRFGWVEFPGEFWNKSDKPFHSQTKAGADLNSSCIFDAFSSGKSSKKKNTTQSFQTNALNYSQLQMDARLRRFFDDLFSEIENINDKNSTYNNLNRNFSSRNNDTSKYNSFNGNKNKQLKGTNSWNIYRWEQNKRSQQEENFEEYFRIPLLYEQDYFGKNVCTSLTHCTMLNYDTTQILLQSISDIFRQNLTSLPKIILRKFDLASGEKTTVFIVSNNPSPKRIFSALERLPGKSTIAANATSNTELCQTKSQYHFSATKNSSGSLMPSDVLEGYEEQLKLSNEPLSSCMLEKNAVQLKLSNESLSSCVFESDNEQQLKHSNESLSSSALESDDDYHVPSEREALDVVIRQRLNCWLMGNDENSHSRYKKKLQSSRHQPSKKGGDLTGSSNEIRRRRVVAKSNASTNTTVVASWKPIKKTNYRGGCDSDSSSLDGSFKRATSWSSSESNFSDCDSRSSAPPPTSSRIFGPEKELPVSEPQGLQFVEVVYTALRQLCCYDLRDDISLDWDFEEVVFEELSTKQIYQHLEPQ